MRKFEHVPEEVMNAITGEEVKDLIEKGIPPFFLRGMQPQAYQTDEQRTREQQALGYGLRRLEGQGGLTIGDGLNHGSPILLGEYARRALEDTRWTIRRAATYRETIQRLANQVLADAQVTHPEAELPPSLGPEEYMPDTPTEQLPQTTHEQHDLNQPTV